MKERIEINKSENFDEPVHKIDESVQKKEVKKPKRSKVKWAGTILGLILVLAGLIWYAVNLGLIPIDFIVEQAGPILIVIIGILILIKSL